MGGGSDKRSPFLSKSTLDEDDFRLPSAEKRQRVENELAELRQRCQKAGLSESEVATCAKPFVLCAKKKDRVARLKALMVCSLLLAVSSGLLINQTTNDWITTHLRLFSIHVIMPFWDFTMYYNDQCLIDNPLYDEAANRAELDCDICKEFGKNIESMSAKKADPRVIFDDYLQLNVPLVVHNAFDDWRATEELSVDKLHQLYSSDPVLSKEEVCDVTGLSSFAAVMKRLSNPQKTKSMTVTWQNCNKAAYKQFRKFYRRPTFLPGAAEAVHSNFVVLSMGSEKSRTRDGVVIPPGPEGDIAMWIGQVHGKLEYLLAPVRDCAHACKLMKVTLMPGDFLLVPLEMWEVSFRPLGADAKDAIAIGSGLTWDVSG